jgi:hypothetical protein
MSQGLLEVLAEFFDAIGSQKAHWYRVFDPGNGDEAYPLIQSTFPSLASLMKMESVFIWELFLVVGLVRKKLHHGAYILYADRGAWDSFIQNFGLGMETTFFSIKNKKSLYIKVGEWSNTRHLSRTPGNIWKEASKRGFYDIPKLRISSAAIKLARNIGKQFTNNGVCARRLLANAKTIFEDIQGYLLHYENDEKCSAEYILHFCGLYSSIFTTLDLITAKLRIKSGNTTVEDHDTLERSLRIFKELWDSADLSYTPKVHSLLNHAAKQMRRFNGIGDLLEDDVEKMHQIAGNFESRASRLKSANNRSFTQAKMEAMSHNNAVRKCIEQSQQQSKRKSDDEKPSFKESFKVQKTERNQKRLDTVKRIEDNPPPKLITAYKKLKEDIKKLSSNA